MHTPRDMNGLDLAVDHPVKLLKVPAGAAKGIRAGQKGVIDDITPDGRVVVCLTGETPDDVLIVTVAGGMVERLITRK
jgi:hypothetical protein